MGRVGVRRGNLARVATKIKSGTGWRECVGMARVRRGDAEWNLLIPTSSRNPDFNSTVLLYLYATEWIGISVAECSLPRCFVLAGTKLALELLTAELGCPDCESAREPVQRVLSPSSTTSYNPEPSILKFPHHPLPTSLVSELDHLYHGQPNPTAKSYTITMSLLMDIEGMEFDLPDTSMAALRQLDAGFTRLETTPAADKIAESVEILVQMRAIIDAADTASGWAYKEHELHCKHGHCLLRLQIDWFCGAFYGERERSERRRAVLEEWKRAAEKVPGCQERFRGRHGGVQWAGADHLMGLRDWVQVGVVGLCLLGFLYAGFVEVKLY